MFTVKFHIPTPVKYIDQEFCVLIPTPNSMKMKYLLIPFFFISFTINAQVNENSQVVSETFNDTLLERLIIEELNTKRRYHGKNPVKYEARIYPPAKFHVEALVTQGFFSHVNPQSSDMRDLETRIKTTGLDLDGWAENILYTDNLGLNGAPYYTETIRGEKVVRSHKTGKIVRPNTYRELAIAMVEQWMGSKGHRRNMLYPEFNISAAAVSIKTDDSLDFPLIYAVLVFGKR
jgi:uncharacterized protein YkwD